MRAGWQVATLVALLAWSGSWGNEETKYEEPALEPEDRDHWSFRPLDRAGNPVPEETEKAVDAFVLARLQERGIGDLAPRAEGTVLLRRVRMVLTGLPPTPRESERFLRSWEEDADRAFEEKVEELLASPEYGERWAQHWLDVARFAETDGFEHDKVRGEAWRYRDWVISALNQDLPYDQFVRHQVAGDLEEGSDEGLGTGFLLAGPDMPDINLESERRHNVLNEMTATVGSAFLGLSLGCAQCHDHMTDPISLGDFYRLRAFFDRLQLPAKNKSLPHRYQVAAEGAEGSRFLYLRGDFRRPGIPVEVAFPRVVQGTDLKSPSDRVDLGNWLVSDRNPLAARVIVNRIWQQHFGRGLVETANDFGRSGSRPSHPQLLDWLASELIRGDWSLKSLHRVVLFSRTWQQASFRMTGDDAWSRRLEEDAEGIWLSRFPRRRLDGEAIRDSMLQATGELDRRRGGPGIRPPLPPEVTVTLLKNQWDVTPDASQHLRRSIYLFARRNLRYPMFDVFDRPDANASCASRHVSTTAPQALHLLNSEFSEARARALARAVGVEARSLEVQVEAAYQRVLARSPQEAERKAGASLVEEFGLESLALALFNLNEFVYLD